MKKTTQEEMLDWLGNDDTLRFKLFAETLLTQDDARLTVSVQAVRRTAEQDARATEEQIRAVLQAFVPANWVVTRSHGLRQHGAAGYEWIHFDASTRIPLGEIYNLEERARLARVEGVELFTPLTTVRVTSRRMDEAVGELRRRITLDAMRQAAEFEGLTGRPWRIGDIEFGIYDRNSRSHTSKGAERSSDDTLADLYSEMDDNRLGVAERVSLTAAVTLRTAA